MNYTVVYKPSAEDELAAIWLAAADRDAVTAAADEIDDLLRRDPLVQGESRGGANRILFRPPLVVQYRVDEADHTVLVAEVKGYGRPA